MNSGLIYQAKHRESGRVYIGATMGSMDERRSAHRFANSNFGRFLRELGDENFEWTVLRDGIAANDLGAHENYYIEVTRAKHPENGFNRRGGGGSFPVNGKKRGIACIVSEEVGGWIKAEAAKDRRSVSEYLFLLLDQAMQMEKASKCRRRKC
jgi:hypothetical protein